MPSTVDQHHSNLAEEAVANDFGVYGPRTVCVKLDPYCKLHYSPCNRYWLGATFTDGSRVTYDRAGALGLRMTAHPAEVNS